MYNLEKVIPIKNNNKLFFNKKIIDEKDIQPTKNFFPPEYQLLRKEKPTGKDVMNTQWNKRA